VLLGDVLELRNRPVSEVLAAAEPVFRDLAGALGDRPVLILPGNHDHPLVGRALAAHSAPLGLEQRFTPEEASDTAAALAGFFGSANVEFAYPGVWLREDVYAMHGHYLDAHITVPTFERLAIAASGRIALDSASGSWNDLNSVSDYEALLQPIYAWMHSAAQSGRPSPAINGGGAVRAWQALRSGRRGGIRAQAFTTAFPVAVRTLNALGLGPLSSELSSAELRSAGLRAMSEVVERLQVRARHVIFGHTHRAGILDDDSPPEWLTPNGVQLHNTGSWVYLQTLIGRGHAQSPYWPGSAILLEDAAPPRLLHLLVDREPEQLTSHPLGQRPARP
jgi:hypothetical protein